MREFPVAALLAVVVAGGGGACSTRGDTASDGPLIVFNAGSLARPLRAALDTFARREGIVTEQESAGSLETARKLTELGKIPDLVALADADVFPGYLMPEQIDGYVEFARNRMVLAGTDRSRGVDRLEGGGWTRVLLEPGVEIGRADPDLDPSGYRTLMLFDLAERHFARPGLAARLLAASPPRNVRAKAADLIGLLQVGEFDYAWMYESVARSSGLRYVRLPVEVDLSAADHASTYALAHVEVRGSGIGERVTFRGQPIVYALGIPRAAPHRALAERFAAFLLSPEGRSLLRREGLDALDTTRALGSVGPWAVQP